jgi:hypothetical protein
MAMLDEDGQSSNFSDLKSLKWLDCRGSMAMKDFKDQTRFENLSRRLEDLPVMRT